MIRKLWSIVSYCLLGVVLITSVLFLYRGYQNPTVPPSVYGVTPLRISSGSMGPRYTVGTIVFAVKKPTYDAGEVISFYEGNKIITHRIFEVEGDRYVTKGDYNDRVDEQKVQKKELIGKVQGVIPYMPLYKWVFLSFCMFILIVLVRTRNTHSKETLKNLEEVYSDGGLSRVQTHKRKK